MRIGAAWQNISDKGVPYISLGFSEDILPLIITPDKGFALFPNDDKKEDKDPDFTVVMSKKKKKE